ncbi:MAG: hypothetical protein ABSG62_19305 [Terracidiphilus sp.]|jgi:hypothetical protein
MPKSKANEDKAQFIFEQVFGESNLKWIGPEFDFDRDSYKARIQAGSLKGQLLYISIENLEDRDVSAEQIKQKLLAQLDQELASARQKKV